MHYRTRAFRSGATLLACFAGVIAEAQDDTAKRTVIWGVAYEHALDSITGGDASGHTFGSGLLDAGVEVDLEAATSRVPGILFAQYLWRHGPSGSDTLGDLQGHSNLDAERFNHLEEIWYEFAPGNDRWRLKLGQVDANSEFAHVDAAGEFTNASAGFSPTIFAMPSYPEAALSANAFLQVTGRLRLGAGIYGGTLRARSDEMFSDPFSIAELDCNLDGLAGPGGGRAAIGVWYQSGSIERLDGGTDDGAEGFYGLIEKRIWLENPENVDDEQGFSVFAQFGYVSDDVATITQHVSLGVSGIGLLPGRSRDTMGLMWSLARTSRVDASGFDADENLVEAFYCLRMADWLCMKPVAQWIGHPGGVAARPDALVVSLRTVVEY